MIEPQLNEVEVRVLGSLIEKSVTTPENYPLSLNSLVNACNQKSNRDPVVEYDSATVGEALTSLRTKGLARIIMGGDSRVPKYQHYFEEMYHLSMAESAAICELMLRGPQTPSEVRGRIERFNVHLSPTAVEDLLTGLQTRAEPLLKLLPRQPGRREARFAHLLAGEPVVRDEAESTTPRPARDERLTTLEEEVQHLRQELDALRQQFAEFQKQFE